MLRMLGRRSVRRSVRRGRREREVRPVRVRRGEMPTAPPDKLPKHLLPCHVRLLDGTDLYCQLPVSCESELMSELIVVMFSQPCLKLQTRELLYSEPGFFLILMFSVLI